MKNLCFFFTLFLSLNSFSATVDTLKIESLAMGKTYKAAVVTPNSYSKSKDKFAVLYLLHGAYGHFDDWLKKTPNKNTVKDLADQYNIIIVMPEGETFSFYLDSPISKQSQFETYITKEVISKIDATYRTIANKNGRVISGLSMGGHGALYLSVKNPELFCAAGSMSGVADMSSVFTPESLEKMKPLISPILGDKITQENVFENYSILGKLKELKANKMPLIIDCGIDDFLIESNRELHRRLVYNKIPHEYTEKPGAHTWEYWQNSLPFHVLFFNTILKKSDNN